MIASLKRLMKYIRNWYRIHSLVKYPLSSEISLSAEFEGSNRIGEHCVFNGSMGYGSYMGDMNNLTAKIGRFTSIGHNCSIFTGRHPYTYPYVTTSPMFYSLKNQTGKTFATKQVFNEEHAFADSSKKYKVVIGNDCWIQSDVKFVAGVHIADGAVVLSGAIVSKDIPPYSIVGGVPAKVIKYRYQDDDIHFLLKDQWWNNDIKWICEHWNLLNDFDKYKELICNGNR